MLVYLLRSVDIHELARQLSHTHLGWTVIGVALAPIGLWVRAQRWRYLFPPRSEPPGLVPAIMIGYMANNVLPLRAGELVRVYVVARRWRHGMWTTVATLIVERLLDSLMLVLVLGVLILLVPVPAIFRWTAIALLTIDAVGIAAIAAVAAAPDRCRRLLTWLLRRWPHLQERTAHGVDTFVRGLDGVRARAHIVPLIVWTALVWLCPALTSWSMLRAVNLDLPFVAGWTVLAFVGLGISIPSAPGYVGVFHYAAVLAVEIFGVSRSEAVGYALVFHASQMIPITLAGWLFLLREHMSLGEATRARAAETTAPRL